MVQTGFPGRGRGGRLNRRTDRGGADHGGRRAKWLKRGTQYGPFGKIAG